jgi:hypothetical protein
MHETLTMLPEVQARRLLAGTPLTLEILRPPYPALGVGMLRVLRVRELPGGPLEVMAGYDNYEPVSSIPRTAGQPPRTA